MAIKQLCIISIFTYLLINSSFTQSFTCLLFPVLVTFTYILTSAHQIWLRASNSALATDFVHVINANIELNWMDWYHRMLHCRRRC